MMPPPEKCEDAARRQATSVAVRNSAFPSTMYLDGENERRSPQRLNHSLHGRPRVTLGSVDVLPVQRPRHLDEVFSTLLRFQIKLLRVGQRDWGGLAHSVCCTHWDRKVIVATRYSSVDWHAALRERLKAAGKVVSGVTCRAEKHLGNLLQLHLA